MGARLFAAGSMNALFLLAACSRDPGAEQSAARDNKAAAAPTETDGGVTRNVVKPAAAPAPPPPMPAAIQTQPGPNGTQVALNRVAVTGDILTVALTVQGGKCCTYIPVEQVSAIDDATAQRISVLKDNAGNWMAAPMGSGGQARIGYDGPTTQLWFKFPAPPVTSKTVSIAIPGVAPFDGVPIAR